VADAARAASLHMTTFARFEGWAQRVARSDVALHGDQALHEAMFAPLRGEQSVLWAEVRDDTGKALQFQAPIALEALAFVKIDGAELGALRVAVSKDCRAASRPKVVGKPCVVIASAPVPNRPRHGSLYMAFRLPSG